jgi:hypothetical protein
MSQLDNRQGTVMHAHIQISLAVALSHSSTCSQSLSDNPNTIESA